MANISLSCRWFLVMSTLWGYAELHCNSHLNNCAWNKTVRKIKSHWCQGDDIGKWQGKESKDFFKRQILHYIIFFFFFFETESVWSTNKNKIKQKKSRQESYKDISISGHLQGEKLSLRQTPENITVCVVTGSFFQKAYWRLHWIQQGPIELQN